jgi:hypothetical protein
VKNLGEKLLGVAANIFVLAEHSATDDREESTEKKDISIKKIVKFYPGQKEWWRMNLRQTTALLMMNCI